MSTIMEAIPSSRHRIKEDLRIEGRWRMPRILFVEDHPFQQKVLQTLSKSFSIESSFARTASEALSKLSSEQFDLVIMDWQLADPKEDGLVCTQKIRLQDRQRNTHTNIVGLTANSTPEDRLACLKAGMDDCYSKPLRPENFEAILDRWIPKE